MMLKTETSAGMGAESSMRSFQLTLVLSGLNIGSVLTFLACLVATCHWLEGGAGPKAATEANKGLVAFGAVGAGSGRGTGFVVAGAGPWAARGLV